MALVGVWVQVDGVTDQASYGMVKAQDGVAEEALDGVTEEALEEALEEAMEEDFEDVLLQEEEDADDLFFFINLLISFQ